MAHKIENVLFIVTGSSGFLGRHLCNLLEREVHQFIGVDRIPSKSTNIIKSLSKLTLDDIPKDRRIAVIHCAAARTDFGLKAQEYFVENVEETERFLEYLLEYNQLEYFLHISSVAALDGRTITFESNLGWDDAYRSTKYLQQLVIENWCTDKGIPLCVLYPSAIFDYSTRFDTNIGKLIAFTRKFRFFPRIKTRKSLTELSGFSKFILTCQRTRRTGHYLCIEKPVKSVSEIIVENTPKSVKLV